MWENVNVCEINTKQFFTDAQITNRHYLDYTDLEEFNNALTLFILRKENSATLNINIYKIVVVGITIEGNIPVC